MQRWLAPREIDDVQLLMVVEQMLQNQPHILPRQPVRRIVFVDRVANGTIQIAGRSDGNDRQINLLLMRRTRPAIKRATLRRHLRLRRPMRRQKRQAVEIPLHRARHDHLLRPVLRTKLIKPNRIIAKNNLGIHRFLANPAQTLRHRKVSMIRRPAHRKISNRLAHG